MFPRAVERQEDDLAQIEIGLGQRVKGGAVVGKDRLLSGGDERHGGGARHPLDVLPGPVVCDTPRKSSKRGKFRSGWS